MIPEVRERYDQVRNGIIPQGYKQTALGIVPQEWEEFSLGEIYSERKQAGDPSLPVLSVSIHTGVSDGELDEESLGKKVKRIEDKTQYRTALEGDLVFNMMRAWYFATALAKQYESTLPFLESKTLDTFTHNKAIQKARESFRVSPEHKAYLKTLKYTKVK